MVYCRKCAAPMTEGDLVCTRCGTPVVNAVRQSEKDERIKDLEEYRTLLSENEELKRMIKPQSEFPMYDSSDYKKRSFIRYFWPFIIGAVAAYTIIYILSIIITFSSLETIMTTARSAERVSSRILGDTYGGLFVGIIVAVLIIVIGIKISKSKQNAFNSNAEFMNMQITEKYRAGLKNQKMIDIYQDNINRMRKYERFVPEPYRTSLQVDAIIKILKEDKAQTIDEAIALL